MTTLARNRQGAGTLLVTASDPAGPWSDPIVLDAEGIDPSLFFDDDGRCWFTACRDSVQPNASGPGELWMRELDPGAKALVGPTHILWHGAMNGAWVEAPHLYKHDGAYHLIAAQGETWAVVPGTRPVSGFHRLGREVFLVSAEWTERGLVFAPGVGQVSRIQAKPRIDVDKKRISNKYSNTAAMRGSGVEWVSLRQLPPPVHPSGEMGSSRLSMGRKPAWPSIRVLPDLQR